MLPTILLAALLGQSASTIQGAAMGPNNQPVGQALIFISHGPADDGSVPALGQGMTDAQGRYRLEVAKGSATRSVALQLPTIFAYRPGMALLGSTIGQPGTERDAKAFQLALLPAAKRSIKVITNAGGPLAGVRVAPLQVALAGPTGRRMAIPDALGERLAVTSGPDGRAVTNYLASSYELQVVRVTLPGGTSHVVELPPAMTVADPAVIVIDPGGRLSGRVRTEDGKPAAGALVVVHPKFVTSTFGMSTVRFAGGPVRVGDDGTFRTPPGLLQGKDYHVMVKAEGWEQKAPSVVTLSAGADAVTNSPEIVLTPKRSIAGRVVDRQGHAVADAEIIANGLGTGARARSQSQGQFRVTGLGPGRAAVLVIRGEGYRITGRVVGEREAKDLEVVLARTDETPLPAMTTLPSPVPEEERRKLARQLLDPYFQKALTVGNDTDKSWAIRALIAVDPDAALELLDKTTFTSRVDEQQGFLRERIVLELADTDAAKAAAVARSIKDPKARALALLELAWLLPKADVKRKHELIGQAVSAAREITKPEQQTFMLAKSAATLTDCGETEQAKSLAAEVREGLEKMANPAAPFFAQGALVRLGRVDLPAARAIIEKQVAEPDRAITLGNIAPQLAASDPAEAERLLDEVKTLPSRYDLALRTCYRMAPVDLPRARKIALAQTDGSRRATALVVVASTLTASQRSAARDLVQQALAEVDRSQGEQESLGFSLHPLLPMLEAIDPTLVPELFWRILAQPNLQFREMLGLARYDRDVAAALFTTDLMTKAISSPSGSSQTATLYLPELASRDPRRAVEAALAMPEPANASYNANVSRATLIEFLGRPPSSRWNYRQSPYAGFERVLHEDVDITH